MNFFPGRSGICFNLTFYRASIKTCSSNWFKLNRFQRLNRKDVVGPQVQSAEVSGSISPQESSSNTNPPRLEDRPLNTVDVSAVRR